MNVQRTQPAMRLDVEHLSAIVDAARDGIITIDRLGRVTMFNRAATEMFGYAEDEVLGRPVTLLMPPPDRDEHPEYIRRYEETGVAQAIGLIRKVEARRKNGEVFPIELSVSQARTGTEVIYSAIIRDVTAQRATEEALRSETELASSIVAAAPLAVLILDPEGRIRLFNPYLERLSGRRLVEVEGRDWFTTFLPERHRTGIGKSFARAITGTATRGKVSPIVTKGGAEVEIEWHDATLHDQSGAVVGLLAMGHDVTERRRYRERARLAEIGAVAARVVHDLRNPLAGLSMAAQRLLRHVERDAGGTSDLRSSAQLVLDTAGRLDRLIGEFRDVARELRLDIAEVDLPSFLGRLAEFWSHEAAAHGIDLVVEPPPGSVRTVPADDDRLRRVFDNLLKNAIEALAGGGRITVATVVPESGKVRITVADDGPGIPDGRDVFALFTTTKASGTGLGLPIARQIAEAHGGGITLAFAKPHGAVFHVDLPAPGTSLR
jgi:PAS domain S-box-containing protein